MYRKKEGRNSDLLFRTYALYFALFCNPVSLIGPVRIVLLSVDFNKGSNLVVVSGSLLQTGGILVPLVSWILGGEGVLISTVLLGGFVDFISVYSSVITDSAPFDADPALAVGSAGCGVVLYDFQ